MSFRAQHLGLSSSRTVRIFALLYPTILLTCRLYLVCCLLVAGYIYKMESLDALARLRTEYPELDETVLLEALRDNEDDYVMAREALKVSFVHCIERSMLGC